MKLIIPFFLFCFILSIATEAQPVTGVWRGKVQGKKHYQVELKLIRNADSITGTSYYYHSDKQYARYLVKGYFNHDGEVVWWNDQLIENKGFGTTEADFFQLTADFNCPGGDIMKLDGTGSNSENGNPLEVHLDKMKNPVFPDEWDEVIDNFPFYAFTPGLIDSVAQQSIARTEPVPEKPKEKTVAVAKKQKTTPAKNIPAEGAVAISFPVTSKAPDKRTVEEKFVARKKIFTSEIPITGDSISLSFYDHAEIDGDSIALFLNGKMMYQHILLKAEPFTFKLAVADLSPENEMIMVAENLGSIPPNTSLMIAWVNGQRYEARLESNENSSAMIRFIKPPDQAGIKKQ